MRVYKKPAIIAVDDLAEDVYMASGSVDTAGSGSAGQGSVTAGIEVTGSNGSDTIWFNVTVTNNSDVAVEGWTASLSFSGPVKGAEFSSCKVAVSGNVVTFSPAFDWNNTLGANSVYTTSGSVTGDTVLTLA